jgi:GTP:adenosylcobinamide-phosphate guanylyltransferase
MINSPGFSQKEYNQALGNECRNERKKNEENRTIHPIKTIPILASFCEDFPLRCITMDGLGSHSEYNEFRSPEYQAIIIVDYDDGRLFPLTEFTPKCLLPIANRKLLTYQLDMLSKSGIVETFIVTTEEFSTSLKQYCEEYPRDGDNMKVELISLPEIIGTADGLRAVADRIRGDFIVLSCDVISQFSLIDLCNLHRLSSSDMTIMLTVPTNKEYLKDDVDQEYIGITSEGRIIFKKPTLELDEGITISKALIHRIPRASSSSGSTSSFSLRNDLMDVGIYLFSHWIIEFIRSNRRISSIKSDLLPYLINRQFQSKEYLYSKIPALEFRKRPLSFLEKWQLSQDSTSSSSLTKDFFSSSISDYQPDSSSSPTISQSSENYDYLRCFGIIYSQPTTNQEATSSLTVPPLILCRVNTIPTYLSLNKYAISLSRFIDFLTYLFLFLGKCLLFLILQEHHGQD